MSSKWTKKDKIACTIIFSIAIITFAVFFSGITLSYFFDTHTAFDTIEAGRVDIEIVGGANNDGQIKFPSVITPNTLYSIDDYMTGSNRDLALKVKNNSTSGPVFIMVKLTSDDLDVISPVSYTDTRGKYWVSGEGHPEYLYYMTALDQNDITNPLCYYWQVGNFDDPVKNDGQFPNISLKTNAYAVQAQGGAVLELINDTTSTEDAIKGWRFAPQIFRDMVVSYT